jgi:chaperone modulatory protein CbpM
MRTHRPNDQAAAQHGLSLGDICRGCGVTAETIIVLVGEGVLAPRGRAEGDWVFDADDLIRARCALRIQQDLGVNTAGAALAVELIDELKRLRRRVAVLESLAFRR